MVAMAAVSSLATARLDRRTIGVGTNGRTQVECNPRIRRSSPPLFRISASTRVVTLKSRQSFASRGRMLAIGTPPRMRSSRSVSEYAADWPCARDGKTDSHQCDQRKRPSTSSGHWHCKSPKSRRRPPGEGGSGVHQRTRNEESNEILFRARSDRHRFRARPLVLVRPWRRTLLGSHSNLIASVATVKKILSSGYLRYRVWLATR